METSHEDLLRSPASRVAEYDVVMAGDVCFVKGLADAFQAWLASVAEDGRKDGADARTRTVLLGDPARQMRWAPTAGWAKGARRVAEYEVVTAATSALTEGAPVRSTSVWRVD